MCKLMLDYIKPVLDPDGIPLDTTYGPQKNPTLAFDGSNFLVVWCWNSDVYGTRVSQTGQVLDTNFIPISTAALFQRSPSIAFDGNNFMVVWEDCRNLQWHDNKFDIYGARINQSGIVLDTVNLRISQAPGYQTCPSVEFDGTNYLVVWEDSRSDSSYDIYGAKVKPSGELINTYPIVIQSEHQFEPFLAHGNSDQILIAYSGWTDSINVHPAHVMRIWATFYPFVGIQETDQNVTIAHLDLNIFPNPCRRRTKIEFSLGNEISGTKCSIEIFDITGRLMRIFPINQCDQNISVKSVYWDGTDNQGRIVSAGMYFCQLKHDMYTLSQKIVFLK